MPSTSSGLCSYSYHEGFIIHYLMSSSNLYIYYIFLKMLHTYCIKIQWGLQCFPSKWQWEVKLSDFPCHCVKLRSFSSQLLELPVEISTQLWELDTFHLYQIGMIQLINVAKLNALPPTKTLWPLMGVFPHGRCSCIWYKWDGFKTRSLRSSRSRFKVIQLYV